MPTSKAWPAIFGLLGNNASNAYGLTGRHKVGPYEFLSVPKANLLLILYVGADLVSARYVYINLPLLTID